MKLPIATTINGDRVVGAGLGLATKEPSIGDLFVYADTSARVNRELAEHARRNKAKRVVPLWHHWRFGKLAIHWRWCK